MGTTVSNLQILGAALKDVRAALPRTLVGQWSERFVTACPELSPGNAERRAAALSKKLDCTLLLVNMFDGDALWLTVYRGGKRLTGHAALPEKCRTGDTGLFCSALGLPEELAPKLKRLFTGCVMQEEKLGILEALLGAPLFVRWDDKDACFVRADTGPLEEWLAEHPLPPKIKNRCKAELLQEIADRHPEYGTELLILRPAVREGDDAGWYSEDRAGDILGYAHRGGERARFLPDGRMELIPMEDGDIKSDFGNISFSCLGDRMIMMIACYGPDPSGFPGAQRPVQTVVVRDTANCIPCPLALTWEGEPVVGNITPLPDGGHLMDVSARYDGSRPPVKTREELLACYGPDGTLRWTVPDINICKVTQDRLYAVRDGNGFYDLLLLNPDGTTAGEYRAPAGSRPLFLGETLYLMRDEYRDALLTRLTHDLRPDGEVRLPRMSDFALSPDGTLLCAAGFESGLRVIDAKSLQILRDLPRKSTFAAPAVDGRNRLWVANGGYFECYTPELECISRHRLKGSVCLTYCSAGGHACALTFQESKYILRVYCFT